MIVELGEEPTIKNTTFRVIASIYSEEENERIYIQLGGIFDNYDSAYEFWDKWQPSNKILKEFMKNRRKSDHYGHHELEVFIDSDDPNETSSLAYTNTTLDPDGERIGS